MIIDINKKKQESKKDKLSLIPQTDLIKQEVKQANSNVYSIVGLFHKEGTKVETRPKVIDLYRFNHGARICSAAATVLSTLSVLGIAISFFDGNDSFLKGIIWEGFVVATIASATIDKKFKDREDYYLKQIERNEDLKKLLHTKKKK